MAVKRALVSMQLESPNRSRSVVRSAAPLRDDGSICGINVLNAGVVQFRVSPFGRLIGAVSPDLESSALGSSARRYDGYAFTAVLSASTKILPESCCGSKARPVAVPSTVGHPTCPSKSKLQRLCWCVLTTSESAMAKDNSVSFSKERTFMLADPHTS